MTLTTYCVTACEKSCQVEPQ